MNPQRPMSVGRAVGPYHQQPQRALPPQPGFGGAPSPDYQPPQGDQGYNGGAPWGADMRRLQGAWERRLEDALGGLNGRLGEQESQVRELLQIKQNPALAGLAPRGLAGLGEAVQRAVYTGRCLPYNAVVDIFVQAGVAGQQLSGSIFVTQDGPVFISRVIGYAQIDQADEKAKTFPSSLIKSPLCVEGADPLAINANSQFSVSCADLLPDLDVSGRFIPISPKNCPLLCCGTTVCCGTLECEGQTDKTFSVRRPINQLSHPECFDGLIEISTNDCGWQSVAYPMAMLEDAAFDITNESPDCIGVCGFVDCNKVLQVGITPTRPHLFDINVQIVFAGFRVLTCGGPACSTG